MSEMRMTVPTIYGAEIMAAKRHGLDPDLHENSLLNNVIALYPGVPGANRYPQGVTAYTTGEINVMRSRYFIIGTGAHLAQPRNDGATFLMPVPNSPKSAGPYFWLPFKLVKLTGAGAIPDISGPERQQYVMRRLMTIGGDEYAAYCIKRLPVQSGLKPSRLTYVVQSNGQATPPVSFSPSTADMRPTRPALVNGAIPITGRYFEASIPIKVSFTPAEINDLRYVGQILFNNPDAIVISEVGLVYGIERVSFQEYSVPGTIKPVNTNPALAELSTAVVGCWISEVKQLSANSALEIDLDIGATEPEFSEV